MKRIWILAALMGVIVVGVLVMRSRPSGRQAQLMVGQTALGQAVELKRDAYYFSPEALAVPLKSSILVTPDAKTVTVDSSEVPGRAMLWHGRWLVPVREVAEAAGYEYRVNPQTNTIEISAPWADRDRFVNQGREWEIVDIKKLLVPGKINVMYFYSDY